MPSRRTRRAKKENYDAMCTVKHQGCGGAFYFLGFLGALIYYVTTAPTFGEAVLGFFKALVWPAFLVFGALKSMGL